MDKQKKTMTDAIVDSATKARSFAADGISVSQHSIHDLIAADKHLRKSGRCRNMGLRLGRLRNREGHF